MPQRELICPANSIKLGGRCVAGWCRSDERWIRPVSSFTDGTLTQRHYVLDNSKPAMPLDVVRVSLKEPKPEIYQPENWLLEDTRWSYIETLSPDDACSALATALDSGPVLLGNTSDRMSVNSLGGQAVSASLTLVEPQSISWQITTNFKGNRQTRAIFKIGGQRYDLVVTDPAWRVRLGEISLGIYSRNVCGLISNDRILFTVSLGKPMANGECYKLVAGVIVLSVGE